MANIARDLGLNEGLDKLFIARHAQHAMERIGITQLDLIRALSSPNSTIRNDSNSGTYVLRHARLRVVLRKRPDNSLFVISVVNADPGPEFDA